MRTLTVLLFCILNLMFYYQETETQRRTAGYESSSIGAKAISKEDINPCKYVIDLSIRDTARVKLTIIPSNPSSLFNDSLFLIYYPDLILSKDSDFKIFNPREVFIFSEGNNPKISPELESFEGLSGLYKFRFDEDVIIDSIKLEFSFEIPDNGERFGFDKKKQLLLMNWWIPLISGPADIAKINFEYLTEHVAGPGENEIDLKIQFPSDKHCFVPALQNNGYIETETASFAKFSGYSSDLSLCLADKNKYGIQETENENGFTKVYLYPLNTEPQFTERKSRFEKLHKLLPEKCSTNNSNLLILQFPESFTPENYYYESLIGYHETVFELERHKNPDLLFLEGILAQTFHFSNMDVDLDGYWIPTGISKFLAEYYLFKARSTDFVSFRVAGFYPIRGITFMSYHEIAIIYTLGNFEKPFMADYYSHYYNLIPLPAIKGLNGFITDAESFSNIYDQLTPFVIYSIQRFIGEKSFNNFIAGLLNHTHITESVFINELRAQSNECACWFEDNLYRNSNRMDYQLRGFTITDSNEVLVHAERHERGYFPMELAVVTDKDTLYRKWDGREQFYNRKIRFDGELKGIILDPQRRNILDVNFANNSVFIQNGYIAKVYLTMRWIFWIQNAILILGSIA